MIAAESRTSSPAETEEAGRRLSAELAPGDVVLLVGGLGAGKTTFVRGMAEGLGVAGDVTSPTFTLVQSYPGRLTLLHADLWRLERLSEVVDLALDEGLEEGGVLVAEWGEGAFELFGDEALVVYLDEGERESDRLLRFEPHGKRWTTRVERS